jgi:hypothetical protein
MMLAGALAGAPVYGAVAFVSTRADIHADDSLDWQVLGNSGTTVAQPFTLATTTGARQVTVAKASAGAFRRVDQGDGWNGNFTHGDALLWTDGTAGPISLTFDLPVRAVGMQIQKSDQTNPSFTARIEAFDSADNSLGAFSADGTSNANADGSALFMGVSSSLQDIARVEITEIWGEDFAVNWVSIHIPESRSGPLMLAAAALFVLRLRSLSRRSRPH